jgi:hypothetical protein
MDVMMYTLPELLAIHADQIERYGGAPGLRDPGLLEAALYRPQRNICSRGAGAVAAAARYSSSVVDGLTQPWDEGEACRCRGAAAHYLLLDSPEHILLVTPAETLWGIP